MKDEGEHGAGSADSLPFGRDEVDGTLIERLAAVAERQPSAAALSDGGDERFTFEELSLAVDGAGRWLEDRLRGDRSPVAVVMPHRPLAVAAELAVIASGRIVVPLDPSFPRPRLVDMLSQAAPSVVLCDPSTEELARDLGAGEVVVWEALPAAPSSDIELPFVDGRSPAFLLFTSGSTGRPKGAVSDHRAFLSGTRDLARAGALVPSDRLAMVAPLNFAASPCQTFWAMLAGAEVCMFPLRARGLPAFVEWMELVDITAFAAVPTLARGLAAMCASAPLSSLRVMLVGGEALEIEDVPLIRSSSQCAIEIVPLYVATEMMLMSWSSIPASEPVEGLGIMCVGSPVEDRLIELLPFENAADADVGEIAVTAPIITSGYWRDADLTESRFELDEAADRVRFRTGDLGRQTDWGIEIVGRVDSMVKIRGSKVELGAVEAAMRQVPGVGHVAATAVKGEGGRTRLVAHAAGTGDGPLPDVSAIRSHLRAELPFHMVPARIAVHDELPLLSNGKVDRFALSQLHFDDVADAITPPRTPTERRLAELFSRLLGVGEVGVDEDFFELGGDSLLAVEVVIHLEEDFGVELPMSAWIESSTIEAIAARVDARDQGSDSTLVQIQTGDRRREPLFFVNDLHGSALRFSRLAAALGGDQPVWGFDSPLLGGTAADPDTIEEIAAIHVADLLERFPSGPYHLAGYSSNVLVVFEIARQLSEQGHDVGFIGLIDFGPVHVRHALRRDEGPRPPGGWPERAPSDLKVHQRLAHHARRLGRVPSGERAAYVSRAMRLAREYDLAVARMDLRRQGRVRPELRGAYSWYRQMDSALRYRPRPIDAAGVLFLSDQTAKGNMWVSRRLDYASATDPELGWGGLFRGGLTIEPLVGHHNDLIEEPYVDGVGAVIRRALDRHIDDG